MLSRIDRRSHVFGRRLREALRASLRAKIVALAGVVDHRGGLRRIDAHSADWVCGQVDSLPKLARAVCLIRCQANALRSLRVVPRPGNELYPRLKSRRYHLRLNPALSERAATGHKRPSLPEVSVDHFEQLVVHRFGFFFFVAAHGFGGAVVQMIAHQVSGDAAKGFLDAGDLGDDVGAVAVVFDHFLEASDLAFDAAEAVAIGFLELRIDACGFAGFGGCAGAVGDSGVGEGLVFAVDGFSCWHLCIPPRAIYTPGGYFCQIRLTVEAGFDGAISPSVSAWVR
jgi:hypothetical protein